MYNYPGIVIPRAIELSVARVSVAAIRSLQFDALYQYQFYIIDHRKQNKKQETEEHINQIGC